MDGPLDPRQQPYGESRTMAHDPMVVRRNGNRHAKREGRDVMPGTRRRSLARAVSTDTIAPRAELVGASSGQAPSGRVQRFVYRTTLKPVEEPSLSCQAVWLRSL